MIGLISARSRNNVIGKDGKIPWKIRGEQKQFRDLTRGNVVVMGRRTYEEIGHPLPDRDIIVVSKTKRFEDDGVQTAGSFKEALEIAGDRDIYAAGGYSIYKEAIPYADIMYITEVDLLIEDGDVFFPDFREEDFEKETGETLGDEVRFTRTVYRRKKHTDLNIKGERKMSKILILNGSPRKNGSTASLIKAFTEGAMEAGNEVREDYIHGMDINSCLGCDACMKTHAGCVQKDEGMAKIYEDLEWCDVIVFASPVYFGYMTAQLKTVIDRMWAWFNLPDHFGIKKGCVLISTARGTDYSAILDQYGIYGRFMGWNDLGQILGAGKEEEAKALGSSIS